jgi:hypothetical protein
VLVLSIIVLEPKLDALGVAVCAEQRLAKPRDIRTVVRYFVFIV